MDLEDLKKRLIKFGQSQKIDLVILFGSYAKGYARSDSDVDVAMFKRESLNLIDITGLLASELQTNDIDLVDLKHCDPLLGMIILNEGKILLSEPGQLGMVSSLISRRYADTKKFRDATNYYIKNFLKEQKKQYEPNTE